MAFLIFKSQGFTFLKEKVQRNTGIEETDVSTVSQKMSFQCLLLWLVAAFFSRPSYISVTEVRSKDGMKVKLAAAMQKKNSKHRNPELLLPVKERILRLGGPASFRCVEG